MTNPQDILAAVTAAVKAEPRAQIQGLRVEQQAEAGPITLEGVAADIIGKRRAVNAAWSVVRHKIPIIDHLRVRAQAEDAKALRDELLKTLATENMFTDHTLATEIGDDRQLVHDAGPGAPQIEVRIDGQIVTLTGAVPSLSHRRFAEVLAWWAPGCERVDNHLEFAPPQEDDDGEITDVVRMVLEKDPLVHASQLRIGTAGGIVALEGLVASEEERRLAVRDAWYVPGVWSVVDNVDVRPAG
jgi:osmotically-inducible protein OsmY